MHFKLSNFRWDMSKQMDFWETHDCRTLKDIQDCALKNTFSCQHKLLLDVKLENVVLDELHLMLRITGDHIHSIYSIVFTSKGCPTACFIREESSGDYLLYLYGIEHSLAFRTIAFWLTKCQKSA